MHTKMLSLVMFCKMKHETIKIFNIDIMLFLYRYNFYNISLSFVNIDFSLYNNSR